MGQVQEARRLQYIPRSLSIPLDFSFWFFLTEQSQVHEAAGLDVIVVKAQKLLERSQALWA